MKLCRPKANVQTRAKQEASHTTREDKNQRRRNDFYWRAFQRQYRHIWYICKFSVCVYQYVPAHIKTEFVPEKQKLLRTKWKQLNSRKYFQHIQQRIITLKTPRAKKIMRQKSRQRLHIGRPQRETIPMANNIFPKFNGDQRKVNLEIQFIPLQLAKAKTC